jgi:hypothetical protein
MTIETALQKLQNAYDNKAKVSVNIDMSGGDFVVLTWVKVPDSEVAKIATDQPKDRRTQ